MRALALAVDAIRGRVHAGRWHPARVRVATAAVLVATVTAMLIASAPGSGPSWIGSSAYVAVTALGAVVPAAITVQVLLGQLLAAGVLVDAGARALPLLTADVCGIVATAELLATVARLDTPLARGASGVAGRTGLAELVGGTLFATVALAGRWQGPSGPGAVALSTAVCLLVGARLLRNRR